MTSAGTKYDVINPKQFDIMKAKQKIDVIKVLSKGKHDVMKVNKIKSHNYKQKMTLSNSIKVYLERIFRAA